MTVNDRIFIYNLIVLRKSKGLLQKEMAATMNVSKKRYESWEQYARAVPIQYKIYISRYFSYPLETLLVERLHFFLRNVG